MDLEDIPVQESAMEREELEEDFYVEHLDRMVHGQQEEEYSSEGLQEVHGQQEEDGQAEGLQEVHGQQEEDGSSVQLLLLQELQKVPAHQACHLSMLATM